MAFIPQTIVDYLDNPMGKGSSVISERKMVKDHLTQRFEKLMEKHKKLEYTVYSKGRNIYFHFIIPSESERGNTYDVVLYFSSGNDPLGLQNDMRKLNMKFFCNSPSFTYSYAYVFNQNGLIIPSLKKKLSNNFYTFKPEQKNPYGIISWEKNIFFALSYIMKNRLLLNRSHCVAVSKRYNEKQLFEKIRTDDTITKEIKKFDRQRRDKKAEEKKKLEQERVWILRHKKRKNDPKIKTGVEHITPKGKIKPTKSTRKK